MPKFPLPPTVVPSISSLQWSFAGLVWGQGTDLSNVTVDGLDMPKVNTGDSERPFDSGQFEGVDVFSGRDITFKFHAQAQNDTAMRTLLDSIESVWLPPADGVTETPLWFQRPGGSILCCQVKPRQFRQTAANELTYARRLAATGLLHATSAYIYGATQSQSAPVGGISAGAGFPWTFDLSFGGGGSVGVIDIANTGLVIARPVYVFDGPVDVPVITNNSTGQFFGLNMQLDSGDQVIVDTDLDGPSCTYFPAGSNAGSSVTGNLIAGSTSLRLAVGQNNLVFSSNDGSPTGGQCTVYWAPTYVYGL